MSIDIRALAEAWKDGGNPIIDRFARYVLAVEDALNVDGETTFEAVRAAIARNLERK